MSVPAARITLQLRGLAQLFNSMDPSPFLDRDLDADAEQFILSWARELPAEHPIHLVIKLPEPPPAEAAHEIEASVRHYFRERLEMKRREFRLLMRRGRLSLLIGLAFLGVCLAASDLASKMASRPFAVIVSESFVIVGWVAMWRPLEIYLYDWWPLRDESRVLERLSRLNVRLTHPHHPDEKPPPHPQAT